MRGRLALIAKVAISGTLIYVLFRHVPLAAVRDAWLGFSALAVLAAAGLHLAAIFVSAAKWKIFLPEQPFARLLQFTFIDTFYASVLPGQLTSEVTKAYRLGRRTGDMGRVAVSVWLDKMTGLWSLLALAALGFAFASVGVPVSLLCLALAALLGVTFCVYVAYSPWVAERIAASLGRRPARLAQKISPIFARLAANLARFHSRPGQMGWSLFFGGLYQALAVGITVVLARELGVSVPWWDWLWIFGAVSLAQLAPISIGGLGVREASFVGLLALFSVGAPAALTLSLSIFGLQVFYALVGAAAELHYTLTLRRNPAARP